MTRRWIVSALTMLLISLTLSSCKLFKHKTSKKDKAIALRAKQVADSTSLAIKSEMSKTDSLNIGKVFDSATLDSTSIFANNMLLRTEAIWQKRIQFNTFSAKAKIHYEGGEKSLDFVANIRIKKDSIIWVSVTVAGIVQVARAIITPDSFKAVLYTEKEVYQGPISKADQILPEGLDFYSLQNVLLGNPVLNNATASSAAEESQNWIIRMLQNNYIEQLQFDKGDSTLRMSQLITQGSVNKSLMHTMSNFSMLNNIKIALDRKLNILNDSTAIMVEMNYSNMALDNELSYPFSIPKNYTLK